MGQIGSGPRRADPVRSAAGRWLSVVRPPVAAPRRRVLVVPHAAAGPAALKPLLRRFPGDVEMLGVTLPGREGRIAEPFVALPADPDAVVAAILAEAADVADLPLILLGHSVGATVALAMAVRRPRLFAGVVLSALPAPPTAKRMAGRWSEQELQDLLRRGGATPDELLSSRPWRRHTLDLLRCDLTLGARLLAGTAGATLDLPLTLVGGDADAVAPDPHTARSAVRCARPPRVAVLPGGHFYLLDGPNLDAVAALVGAAGGAPRTSAPDPLHGWGGEDRAPAPPAGWHVSELPRPRAAATHPTRGERRSPGGLPAWGAAGPAPGTGGTDTSTDRGARP